MLNRRIRSLAPGRKQRQHVVCHAMSDDPVAPFADVNPVYEHRLRHVSEEQAQIAEAGLGAGNQPAVTYHRVRVHEKRLERASLAALRGLVAGQTLLLKYCRLPIREAAEVVSLAQRPERLEIRGIDPQ